MKKFSLSHNSELYIFGIAGCGRAFLPASWFPDMRNTLMCFGILSKTSNVFCNCPSVVVWFSTFSWPGKTPTPSIKSPPITTNLIFRAIGSALEIQLINSNNSSSMKNLLPTCKSDRNTAYVSVFERFVVCSGMSGNRTSFAKNPPFLAGTILNIANWSISNVSALSFKSPSKTTISIEPVGSSSVIFVIFLSDFLSETNPQTYKSSLVFVIDFTDSISLTFFDSGLSDIICFNFANLLANNAPYPSTPSAEVILLVGSDNISNSTWCSTSSFIPR